MKPVDITGLRYGQLSAISRAPNKGRRTIWIFQCDCGTLAEIGLEAVRSGQTQSCGCLRRKTTADRSRTHGYSGENRTYRAWLHAKGRCYTPTDAKYPIYGGRGIFMCPAWRENFMQFLLDMGECPVGKSIDRIDPHGGYEPNNCRWATDHEQARTRTDNIWVEYDGKPLILKDYAAAIGVNYKSLHARMKRQGETAYQAAKVLMNS